MSEPERPRKQVGRVRLLVIALILVVGGALFQVIRICSG